MTLVKKQYNGRELPVFKNMDQAREHFARRRISIYKGINALLMVFALIQGFLQVLFDSPLNVELMSVGLLIMGCIYCYLEVASIYAPKDVRLIYSRIEDKWLLFPKVDYPAVAFVRESEDATIEEDFTMEDYLGRFEDDLKKKAIVAHFFAVAIFLPAILLPIAPVLSIDVIVVIAIACVIILYWE
jgi:hypothetical protein